MGKRARQGRAGGASKIVVSVQPLFALLWFFARVDVRAGVSFCFVFARVLLGLVLGASGCWYGPIGV